MANDDADLRDLLKRVVQRAGFEVVTCPDAIEVRALLQDGRFDLAILDRLLPGMAGSREGLDRRVRSDLPCLLLLSTQTSPHASTTGTNVLVDAYVPKPFHINELVAQIERLLAGRTARMHAGGDAS